MDNQINHLEKAIEALEAQRDILGNDVVDAAMIPLRERLVAIQSEMHDTSMQRKQVTILFADVSGFTALVEALDPEEVTITMNALWSRLDGVILDAGGTIDKHIGDALMALFGAPIAREDDPEHAIRAALGMQEQLRQFVEAEENRSGGLFSNLKMRIGINTGPVLVGPVGTTQEYTALGDTVNTASRIEHAAPVGGVLVSQSTYQHVRGLFQVTQLDPLTVKGKSEPLEVYVVEGIRPRSFRVTTRGVAGVETPTLGRDAELEKLCNNWHKAQTSAKVVTVVADAGTGKSRLLYEFTNWMDTLPDRFWLFKGRSTEDMQRSPYSLLRDLFAFQFEIHEVDSAAVAHDKLEKGLTGIMGDDAEAAIPFIGHLIGFDYSSHPQLSGIIGDARQVRDRAYAQILNMFKRIMEDRPLVIFLEDLHWGDDESLQLFEYVIDECRTNSLYIVALSRATIFERRPSWGEETEVYQRIDLQPLTEEHIRQLVDIILQRARNRPQELYDLILQRADGNPYYVEEVIKMMIEEGVIDTSGDEWVIDDNMLEVSQVPATLTGVLQARLDGLPVIERKALQRASVVGRVFWDNVVAYLQEDDVTDSPIPERLPVYLNDLQGKELVFERDTTAFVEAQEYIFKHAILRDVTYESVLLQLRRIYHTQVANWLAERSGERVNEFAGRIGEHYDRAGEAAAAAEWYVRAGQQARDAYAGETAHTFFQRALELWEEGRVPVTDAGALMIEAHEGLGQVLNWMGRFDEAAETFIAMRGIAEQIADQVTEARAWAELAGAVMYSGDLRAALENAENAESVARDSGAQLELARSLQLQSWLRLRLGQADRASELGEEALAICKSIDNKEQIARTLNLLGGQQFMQGHYDPARDYLEEALEVFEEQDDKNNVMSVLNNLGVIAEAQGDYHTAYGRFNAALLMAREIGNRHAESQYVSNRGSASASLGNYEEAIADVERVIELTQGQGIAMLSEAYNNMARAYLGLGKTKEALSAAQQAKSYGEQVEAPDNIAEAWRILGQIASHQGTQVNLEDGKFTAGECFEQSLEIFTSMRMEGQRARTLRSWATHELLHGDAEQGESMWNEALEMFNRLGAKLEAERMKEMPAR